MRLSKNRTVLSAGIVLLFAFSNFTISQDSPVDFSKLTGPYLGQKPPGMIPEVFAPGIISTDGFNGSSGFSMNADMFVFRLIEDPSKEIFVTYMIDGKWTQPVQASWDSKYREGDFAIAPDGRTLYFTSKRPLKGDTEEFEKVNIWKTVITGTGWSEPEIAVDQINLKYLEAYPTITRDGIMYFFSRRPGGIGKADIYLSESDNGKYTDAVNLGKSINTEYEEWDPFIAPDESYIIFSSTKPESIGRDDMYISFKLDTGSWTTAIHMGDKLNSTKSQNRPYVTPDGKYLFFTSDRTGNREVYWVDAKIIDTFKPDEIR
ncbi:MAG: hypothetical protein GY863_07970 [bacterium]|nr:hypothetical protein [bacterium]